MLSGCVIDNLLMGGPAFNSRALQKGDIIVRVDDNDQVRFRGGLVFKAHRLLYHSTLSLRVIKCVIDSPLMGGPAFNSRALEKGDIIVRVDDSDQVISLPHSG